MMLVKWWCPDCREFHIEDIERKTPAGLFYLQVVKCPQTGKFWHRRDIKEEILKEDARSQRESDSEPQSPSCSYPVATDVIATQPETGSGLEEGVL